MVGDAAAAVKLNKRQLAAIERLPEDLRYAYEERAAMLEHGAGLPRPVAEVMAYQWEIVRPKVSAA